jgi:D12 class N6 adenine-specific DNA methyltransferase
VRPPTQYFGSKGRLAPWIASLLPAHHTYVEPFAGSAAVLFAKPPSPTEILNNRDGDLVPLQPTFASLRLLRAALGGGQLLPFGLRRWRHVVRPSGRLGLRFIVALAGVVVGLAGIVAEGVGQGGVQGEHAVQAGEAKDAHDQPIGGADQVDGTVVVVVAAQAPQGADQHAKAHRIYEAHLAKVNHQLSAAGADRVVQAVAQLRSAGEIDLTVDFHDGVATSGGHVQVEEHGGLGVLVRQGTGSRCFGNGTTWLAGVRVALPGSVSACGCQGGKLGWADAAWYRVTVAVHATPAAVLISGYPSPLYTELYDAAGRWRLERPVHKPSSLTSGGRAARGVEVIWSNRPLREQLPLAHPTEAGSIEQGAQP